MMTQCGHRVCKNCLDNYLESQNRRPCPADQDDCVDIAISEVLAVKYYLNLFNMLFSPLCEAIFYITY